MTASRTHSLVNAPRPLDVAGRIRLLIVGRRNKTEGRRVIRVRPD